VQKKHLKRRAANLSIASRTLEDHLAEACAEAPSRNEFWNTYEKELPNLTHLASRKCATSLHGLGHWKVFPDTAGSIIASCGWGILGYFSLHGESFNSALVVLEHTRGDLLQKVGFEVDGIR
jgi:hypothetical protein